MSEELNNVPQTTEQTGETPAQPPVQTPNPYVPGVYPYRTPKKRDKFNTDGKDLIFAAVFIVGTFLGVAWGLWGGLRLGFAIAHAVALIAGSVYFFKKDSRPGVFAVICGFVSLSLAVPFAVTSNETVRMLSVPAAVALEWVWFAALAGKRSGEGDLGLLGLLLGAFSHGFTDTPTALKSIVTDGNTKNKKAVRALTGILCAVPVLCVVIPLLVSSDAAFEGLVSRLIPDLGSLAGQIFVTLIAAPFIIGFAVSLKYRKDTVLNIRSPKGFDTAFLASFFGVLSLCYLVYLFSQTAYFFSAFSGLLPEGYEFSYAEYARRGFFELCGIAGINLVLIFFMILFARKGEKGLPAVLKAAGTFIGVFTIAVVATALSKMFMYIDNYGMTVLRLDTSAFMIFLAAVFIAVIIRCYTDRVKVLQFALVAGGVVLAVLGAVNINAVAAKYNYNAYVSGKLDTIDVEYLVQLGEEGAPYAVKLLSDKDPNVKHQAELCIHGIVDEMYYREYTDENGNIICQEVVKGKMFGKLSQSGVSRRAAYEVLDKVVYGEAYKTYVEEFFEDLNANGEQVYYDNYETYE